MTGVLDQLPDGWRYRVMKGESLVAGSVLFHEFADCIYALNSRYPNIPIEKVKVYGVN